MKVLLAVDGSPCADLAVTLTAGLAWPADSTIRVAQVVETGADIFGGPWPTLAIMEGEAIEKDLVDGAERTVHGAADRLARDGLTVEEIILRGRPATALEDEAERMAADLTVMGSRGHGMIESMLLGSTSAELVDRAHHPVLVARKPSIESVVLAWDGSPSAATAADLVATWPMLRGARIRVVSVADTGMPWWAGFPQPGAGELLPAYLDAAAASRRQHEEEAARLVQRLHAEGVTAQAEVRQGDAAQQILSAATAVDADLIVMGSRGRTGLTRLLLGSVARNVLLHAPCSVLVVRPARATEAHPSTT